MRCDEMRWRARGFCWLRGVLGAVHITVVL